MATSNPRSLTSQSHFSLLPAKPITLQPAFFAICPAKEPVAPAAAETRKFSPGFGLPTSITPT